MSKLLSSPWPTSWLDEVKKNGCEWEEHEWDDDEVQDTIHSVLFDKYIWGRIDMKELADKLSELCDGSLSWKEVEDKLEELVKPKPEPEPE